MAVITVDKSTVYGLDTELLALQQADSNEQTTRANEVTRIDGLISNLSTASTEEITRVEGLVTTEATTRGTEITRVEGLVTAEATARGTADQAVRTDIAVVTDALDGRLDVVEGDDTTVGSIAKSLKDAKAYADSLVTAAGGNITALEGIVDQINGDSLTEGSFRNAIANVVGLAPETLNTLQEIAASIANNPNLDSTLRALITTTVDTAKAEIRGAVSNSLDTLAEVEVALNVLNNPDETVDGSLAKILKDSKTWALNEITTATGVLSQSISDEATARIDGEQAINSALGRIKTAGGLEQDGTYLANGTANYIAAATSLKDADNKLDSAIKALDNDTYSKTETDDLVRNGGAIFKTEVINVVDNKITLAFAPKNGVILNFATVRHTDSNGVSWDIPAVVTATAGGKEFQLYPNTTGQFDGKAVTVQYAY